jgi:Cu/Ag efflux pump CusA
MGLHRLMKRIAAPVVGGVSISTSVSLSSIRRFM